MLQTLAFLETTYIFPAAGAEVSCSLTTVAQPEGRAYFELVVLNVNTSVNRIGVDQARGPSVSYRCYQCE